MRALACLCAEIVEGETEEDAERRRRAMWAIATWLSFDDLRARSKFVLAGGMAPLLKVGDTSSTDRHVRRGWGGWACLAVGWGGIGWAGASNILSSGSCCCSSGGGTAAAEPGGVTCCYRHRLYVCCCSHRR